MLTENRYRNRSIIRDYLNDIGYKNLRNKGIYDFLFKTDIHIADRLTDREFPIDEFKFIMNKIASNRQLLVNIVEKLGEIPSRINFYGHDDHMIGVTFHRSKSNPKKVDINLRTLYRERNSKYRDRNVSVYKVNFV